MSVRSWLLGGTLLIALQAQAQTLPFAGADLMAGLQSGMAGRPDPAAGVLASAATPEAGSRTGLALMEGLLVPGLYQARHGQWFKAGVFVAVEAGVLLLVISPLLTKLMHLDELDDDGGSAHGH